jgi:hypothetical protein
VEQPSKHVLVVAYRTATTKPVLDAIRERASRGPTEFTLLVPADRVVDPNTESPEQALEIALPLFEEAAGRRVEGILGDPDPFIAVRDAVRHRAYSEVIVATLPQAFSRWLRRDLPRRVRQELELPVTHITAERPHVLPKAMPWSRTDRVYGP